MGLRTFKGGVHPYEGKELSKEKPIKDIKPQGLMVYPLSQRIAPALACRSWQYRAQRSEDY